MTSSIGTVSMTSLYGVVIQLLLMFYSGYNIEVVLALPSQPYDGIMRFGRNNLKDLNDTSQLISSSSDGVYCFSIAYHNLLGGVDRKKSDSTFKGGNVSYDEFNLPPTLLLSASYVDTKFDSNSDATETLSANNGAIATFFGGANESGITACAISEAQSSEREEFSYENINFEWIAYQPLPLNNQSNPHTFMLESETPGCTPYDFKIDISKGYVQLLSLEHAVTAGVSHEGHHDTAWIRALNNTAISVCWASYHDHHHHHDGDDHHHDHHSSLKVIGVNFPVNSAITGFSSSSTYRVGTYEFSWPSGAPAVCAVIPLTPTFSYTPHIIVSIELSSSVPDDVAVTSWVDWLNQATMKLCAAQMYWVHGSPLSNLAAKFHYLIFTALQTDENLMDERAITAVIDMTGNFKAGVTGPQNVTDAAFQAAIAQVSYSSGIVNPIDAFFNDTVKQFTLVIKASSQGEFDGLLEEVQSSNSKVSSAFSNIIENAAVSIEAWNDGLYGNAYVVDYCSTILCGSGGFLNLKQEALYFSSAGGHPPNSSSPVIDHRFSCLNGACVGEASIEPLYVDSQGLFSLSSGVLSGGAIAGIVIGCVALIAICVAGYYYFKSGKIRSAF